MLIRTLLLSTAIFSLPTAAFAQTAQPEPAQQAQPNQQGQQQAVTDPAMFTALAAQGDMFEVFSSQLALERSQNEQVRAFAQQMIQDHANASQQLTTAANQEGFQPPTELDERHQAMLDSLDGAEGEAFDQAYLDAQRQAHEQAVMLFQGYAQSGPEGALRQHAEATLPTLQQHHEHVQQLLGTGAQAANQQQATEPNQQQAQAEPAQQPAQQTAEQQAGQQPAAQQPQQQQMVMAEQCMALLNQFTQRLDQEQFWVTGWGNRWGVGVGAAPVAGDGVAAPAAADGIAAPGVDAMMSPWGGVEGDLRSPRAQIRELYGAAQVLGYRGDEEGCAYIVSVLDQTYQDYTARLAEAGVAPANVVDWRQEQLALAQPVAEHAGLQRLNVDDITGTDVRNVQDEGLGSVSDIVIDPRTGQVTYAVIARGGFLGFGTDHVAVPWERFRATPGLNTLILDVPADTLEQAPTIDPNTFGDPNTFAQQDEQIGQFWNQF